MLLAVVVIGAAAGVMLRPHPLPLAARFRTASVTRGPVVAEVIATGNVEAITTVEVGAEISGRIVSVDVDFNDRVKHGDVLARFDRDALDAQRAQCRASMATARASLQQALTASLRSQRDYERAEALYAAGSATEELRDERRVAAEIGRQIVRAGEAELAARKAAFDLANTNANHAIIRAPIDGVVITRNVDPGQTVASVLQTPVLFTVAADLRAMRVIAAVDEADVSSVRASQRATFTVHAFPDRRFSATVTKVRSSPTTVHDVVTYGVELSVRNDDLSLMPGMTASVHIVTGESPDTLRVPVPALSFTPPGNEPSPFPCVWILEREALRSVKVVPGFSDGELISVSSTELARGMRVLVDLTPEGRTTYGIGR